MILLNDFARQWQETREEAIAAFDAVGQSAWYILGHSVKDFEAAFAQYCGQQHAIGVASGLDAIEISLRCLGCKPGDKVLTTPLSAFATTLAIVKIGAVPVFVDTDAFGLVDLKAAQNALYRDPAIRFFVPVHLFGHAVDLHSLSDLREELALTIVEDCAQSVGAESHGLRTGTMGQMSATSFYPTKNLGGMGDGGAILTNDADAAALARKLRDYGQGQKYKHDVIGLNSRLDELQAALLLRVNMPRLDRWIDRRRSIASAYIENISHKKVKVPGQPAGSKSCWHLFPVLIPPEDKALFIAYLKEQGITTAEHYPYAIPDQQALSEVVFEVGNGGIENARAFCNSEVSLPIHPFLTDAEIATVIETVNNWSV